MAKLDCLVVWDDKALSRYIQNSPEVTNALSDVADKKAGEINRTIYAAMKAGYDKGDAVRVSMRKLKHTQAAVIHPCKSGVARYMKKHKIDW